MALVSEFKKIESDDKIKYNTYLFTLKSRNNC